MISDFGPLPPERPAVISFDCAHTLLQANWNPAALAVACLEECGHPVDRATATDAYNVKLRLGWVDYQRICRAAKPEQCDTWWRNLSIAWAGELGISEADALNGYHRAFEKIYEPGGPMFGPYPDTIPALQRLQHAGFRMIVISNWDATLRRHLAVQGIAQFFEHQVASLEFGIEKPDPRLFHHAASLCAVRPEQVMHVGDNPIDDVQGARDAGMVGIMVDRGRDFSLAPLFQSLTDFAEWLCG